MESTISKIVSIFLISSTSVFIIYCILKRKALLTETVLKICSGTLFLAVGIICMLQPFIPGFSDWLNQAIIPMTIVGILIITSVIQSIWNSDP